MTIEVDGTSQRHPRKTYQDTLKEVSKVLACPERMHRSGTNGERKSRGQLANTGSPGKWQLKQRVYVVCAKC